MTISTKGRYGLRAVLDLALNSNGEYVTLKSIAERQELSLNYMEHSFSALKKAGYVVGLTGINGGYKLNLPPEEITVQMLLDVLEGGMSIADDLPRSGETLLQRCLRENVWDKVDANINGIIAKTTLQDMINEYRRRVKEE